MNRPPLSRQLLAVRLVPAAQPPAFESTSAAAGGAERVIKVPLGQGVPTALSGQPATIL